MIATLLPSGLYGWPCPNCGNPVESPTKPNPNEMTCDFCPRETMQPTQPPRNVRTREVLVASWRAAQKHAEQTGFLAQHPVSAAGELIAASARLVPASKVMAVALDVANERAKEFPWWAGVADLLRKVDIEERAERCEPKIADVFGETVPARKLRLVSDGGF